jgi:hypothetical protein
VARWQAQRKFAAASDRKHSRRASLASVLLGMLRAYRLRNRHHSGSLCSTPARRA